MKILFQNSEGGVSTVIPVPDCGLTVEQIAFKDVPAGLPFRIVEDEIEPDGVTFDEFDGVGVGAMAFWAQGEQA